VKIYPIAFMRLAVDVVGCLQSTRYGIGEMVGVDYSVFV